MMFYHAGMTANSYLASSVLLCKRSIDMREIRDFGGPSLPRRAEYNDDVLTPLKPASMLAGAGARSRG